jgi:hypothetical protein
MSKQDRDPRKKFLELAERRVEKAATYLKLVGNLGNKSLYESSEDERKKMKKYLRVALNEMEANLDRKPKTERDGFKF